MSRPSKERIEDIKNEVDFILSTVSSKDKCYECAKMMHDLLAEISALTAERDLAFKAEDAKADYARELIKKRDTLREQVRGLSEALQSLAEYQFNLGDRTGELVKQHAGVHLCFVFSVIVGLFLSKDLSNNTPKKRFPSGARRRRRDDRIL